VTGIWYYVWVDPAWRLDTYRADEYGEGVDHLTVWKKYVVPILRKRYKLKAAVAQQVADVAYGVPRGRVDQVSPDIYKSGEKPGNWMFYCGNDFPSTLTLESERRKLISAFGLSRLAAKAPDRIRFELAAHEKMVPEDQEKLQKLLGVKIPY